MNLEAIRDYCLSKTGVVEVLPFGDDTLAFKIGEKLFLLTSIQAGDRFNVKCDPELAVDLRERYPDVQPGYHMNKKHWNTVFFNGSLSEKQLFEMIDHSYLLVLKSLPKNQQATIKAES